LDRFGVRDATGCGCGQRVGRLQRGRGTTTASSTATQAGARRAARAGTARAGATGGAGDGGNVIDLDGGNDGSIGDSGCASTSATAELVPLDIVILLDRSGSMSGTSWNGATNAIKSFVQDPESAGINAGIQYFPPLSGDECDHNNYETLVVDVGPVGPTGTTTPLLINSINTTSPTGLTPMYAGLNGVLFHATALQDANPDHKVIVVLATDGDPTSCNTSVPAIANLASSAYNYNGVETYTIAISGANLTTLNQIAAAGGTGQAFDVTTDITQFAAKMKEIQAAALACEIPIPEPPDGQTLDPGSRQRRLRAERWRAHPVHPQGGGLGRLRRGSRLVLR
jgi:Mg-chelatase subunit ChlD